MAVAALIALSVSGTVILLLRGHAGLKVENAAHRLALTARTARVRAIQSGIAHSLVLDGDAACFLLVREATAEDLAAGAPEGPVVIETVFLPEGVEFEKTAIAGEDGQAAAQVIFEPNGSAQTAAIQIGSNGRHATVTILEATGRVKVEDGIIETAAMDWIDLDEYGTI